MKGGFFSKNRRWFEGDLLFLALVGVLVVTGTLIFSSAALGFLTKNGPSLSAIVWNQLVFGLLLGTVAFIFGANVPHKFWRRASLAIFGLAIIVNLLIFIPGLGITHGGAVRWLNIFGQSFQPAELLKFGFICYLAAWLASVKRGVEEVKTGFLPVAIFFSIVAALMVFQKDTDTLIILIATGMVMYLTAGGRIRHAAMMGLIFLLGLAALLWFRPYAMERVKTFINPGADSAGSSYQIQQSLIAIGSGQINGRGFGQSIQKFKYLPEPVGDSIFAVAAEEFGFIGSTALVCLFLLFALQGFKIARRAGDLFGGLMAQGFIFLIIFQSFMNMSAMLGLIPLTGNPLLFVSQGGTALLFTLLECGIVYNISKSKKTFKTTAS